MESQQSKLDIHLLVRPGHFLLLITYTYAFSSDGEVFLTGG